MMQLPKVQEKINHIFFAQPKAHQYKFAETNKMVPMDPFQLIAFFKQCQTADKAAKREEDGSSSRPSQPQLKLLTALMQDPRLPSKQPMQWRQTTT
jgi:hypothetical protein